MYFKKVPSFFSLLFPKAIWRLPHQQKVYLTFDDGPDPKSTPFLLDTLDVLGIKANFFCLGNKAKQYPDLIHQIIDRGHCIGNHGYDHVSGWTVACDTYMENVEKSLPFIDSTLYRPPYGRISFNQYKALSKKYNIIMWDIMPGDFDARLTDKQVLANLKAHVSQGSIIVMHDTPYAWTKNNNILSDYKAHIDTLNLDFGLLSETIHRK